jgi:hypothetical protein
MPSVLPEDPRQRLALAGLALPVVGLMGLFAWAGSASQPDPAALVQSFVTAYDTGNCSVMLQELYVPGGGPPHRTCMELRRPSRHRFIACTVSGPSPVSGFTAPTLPAGYVKEQVVLARCQGIHVDFYVATQSSSDVMRIVGVEQAR